MNFARISVFLLATLFLVQSDEVLAQDLEAEPAPVIILDPDAGGSTGGGHAGGGGAGQIRDALCGALLDACLHLRPIEAELTRREQALRQAWEDNNCGVYRDTPECAAIADELAKIYEEWRQVVDGMYIVCAPFVPGQFCNYYEPGLYRHLE